MYNIVENFQKYIVDINMTGVHYLVDKIYKDLRYSEDNVLDVTSVMMSCEYYIATRTQMLFFANILRVLPDYYFLNESIVDLKVKFYGETSEIYNTHIYLRLSNEGKLFFFYLFLINRGVRDTNSFNYLSNVMSHDATSIDDHELKQLATLYARSISIFIDDVETIIENEETNQRLFGGRNSIRFEDGQIYSSSELQLRLFFENLYVQKIEKSKREWMSTINEQIHLLNLFVDYYVIEHDAKTLSFVGEACKKFLSYDISHLRNVIIEEDAYQKIEQLMVLIKLQYS